MTICFTESFQQLRKAWGTVLGGGLRRARTRAAAGSGAGGGGIGRTKIDGFGNFGQPRSHGAPRF